MEDMAKLTSKKILVTGGAGFIGSHLVNELVKQKNKVVIIDDLSSGKKENLNPKAKFYKTDVRSKNILKIFKSEKPNIVFHFAAKPIVEEVYKKPAEALEVNIMGTVNVLEACRQAKNIESIIIVSSDKAYGKSKKLPYKESSPLNGDHPYDASKSSADLIAQAYHSTYGLPVLITRFSNVFGPGDPNISRIIPGIMEAIIKNKELLIRSNGKMVREYTYIEDIVDGCIKLAGHKKNYGEAFNFGSKNIFNVFDIIKETDKALGVKTKYKVLNNAKNEIPKQYLDWSKAKKFLRWAPKITFGKAIEKSFDWYKNYYV